MRLRTGRLPDVAGDFSCASCGQVFRAADLDRVLWCEECIAAARRKAQRIGIWFGIGLAGALAAWVFLVEKPTIMIGGWIGAVLATFWLGMRIGRELSYGILRARSGSRPPVQ
ncbi:MAG: hypothetical protein OXL34_10390 [Gemmatimonadota bacterium]|nr:hypothetical protein [Gemmatimonadota bacterium]